MVLLKPVEVVYLVIQIYGVQLRLYLGLFIGKICFAEIAEPEGLAVLDDRVAPSLKVKFGVF